MPAVTYQTKSKIHGTVNLTIIFSIFVLVEAFLWRLIPWWLWLISIPILGFVAMFVGDRIVPLLTNDLIEAIFKTSWTSIESVPFQLKEPWRAIDICQGCKIEKHLSNCLVHGHPLKGLQIKPMAERTDCTEVLLYTSSSSQPIAVVSMEPSGNEPHDSLSPPTRLFTSWDEWRKNEYQNEIAEYTAALKIAKDLTEVNY